MVKAWVNAGTMTRITMTWENVAVTAADPVVVVTGIAGVFVEPAGIHVTGSV